MRSKLKYSVLLIFVAHACCDAVKVTSEKVSREKMKFFALCCHSSLLFCRLSRLSKFRVRLINKATSQMRVTFLQFISDKEAQKFAFGKSIYEISMIKVR